MGKRNISPEGKPYIKLGERNLWEETAGFTGDKPFGVVKSSEGRGTMKFVRYYGLDEDEEHYFDYMKARLLNVVKEWRAKGWITEDEVRELCEYIPPAEPTPRQQALPQAEIRMPKAVTPEVTIPEGMTKAEFVKQNADLVVKEKGRWGTIHYALRTRIGDYQKVGQITSDSPEGVLEQLYDKLVALPKAEPGMSEALEGNQKTQKNLIEMLVDKRITELYPELEELEYKRGRALDRMGEIQEAGGSGARYSAIRDKAEADLVTLQKKIAKEHPELAYL